MDTKIRQRVHELELMYLGHPNPVNMLCVAVANLEAKLAERTRERDQLAEAIEAEYAGTSLGGKPALEIT